MAYLRTNVFWVAANIIFDLGTGETKQVLMLVNREPDATVFGTQNEAYDYLGFVQQHAPHIQWAVDPPMPQRPGWVIRGLQIAKIGV